MLQFSLLGPLRVEHNQVELDVGGGKQRTVLCALLVARSKVVSTDRLVELIWGGLPPAKPYVTVRSYISHLRRTLEPDRQAGNRARLLVTRSPGYALEVDPSSVDIFLFQDKIDEAARLSRDKRSAEAVETLDDALSLWRSLDLSESPLMSFAGEVDRLVELRHEAAALRTDAMLELGQHHELIPDLGQRVEADPRRERPRAQLMVALYRAGRSADALEVYQAGQRFALEATGLAPSRMLVDLEQRILNNDPGLEWRPPASSLLDDAEPAVVERTDLPIGRTDEVALARSVLLPPAGGLAVITGEPGIGKSHLIDHLAQAAKVAGVTALWGQGLQGAGAIPLAPWRSLLLDLIEMVDDDALDQLVGSRAGELGHLLPEIPARLGIAAAESRDPQALHDTISRVLRRFAEQQPLLLCLDDLHWADPASARLLSYVLSNLRNAPLAAVAGWRDTEVIDDELGSALAGLGAHAGAARIELAGLGPANVGDLWTSLGGREAERQAVDDLHRRTGGNPLFITELLRATPETVPSTPTVTVQDAIGARLRTFSKQSRELLNIAALCPGGFSEELLRELSGFEEDALLDCLEDLLQARILIEDPGSISQFTFSHSVIAESLLVQMSSSRKARLHTRIADVLQHKQTPVGQLAHHYLQGVAVGEPVVAATSALHAARTSAQLHDHRGAIDLIERGLTALDRSDDDLLRAELLVELAQEAKYLEHFAQTHSSAQEAFRLAKRAGDINLMVRAAFVYCGQGIEEDRQGLQWLGYWNPPGPALDMLADCLEKLPSGGLRAMVLLAYGAQMFGEYDDVERSSKVMDEAVDEARATGNRRLLAAAIHYQLGTLHRTLSRAERRDLAEQSLQVAGSGGFISTEIAAKRDLMVIALDENDMASARGYAADGLGVVRRLDDPMIAMMAESMTISLDLYQGDFDSAERALGDAMARYERLGSAALDLFGIQYAALERERGNLADVEAMMKWKLSGYPGPAYGVALAMLMAEQGKFDDARHILAEYGDESLLTGGESILQFMIPAFYGATLVALGDVGRARTLYEKLQGAGGRVVSLVNGLVVYGNMSLYLGRLATLIGRHEEASAHLDEAERHHLAVGARPYVLRTSLAKVELMAARGDEAASNRELAEAVLMAEQQSMGWLVEVTRRVLDR